MRLSMAVHSLHRRNKMLKRGRPRRHSAPRLTVERLEDRVTPATPAILQDTLFAGQTFDNDQTTTGNYHVPAGPSGAAGPSHLVSVVNSSIDIINKADGTLVSQTSLNDFFAANSPTTELFGAKVLYDQYSGRFAVIALESGGTGNSDTSDDVSTIHVAVSATDDGAGSWYFMAINGNQDIGGNTWAGDAGLGVSSQALYVTTAQHDFDTGDM